MEATNKKSKEIVGLVLELLFCSHRVPDDVIGNFART